MQGGGAQLVGCLGEVVHRALHPIPAAERQRLGGQGLVLRLRQVLFPQDDLVHPGGRHPLQLGEEIPGAQRPGGDAHNLKHRGNR